jgi:hypothetical protein
LRYLPHQYIGNYFISSATSGVCKKFCLSIAFKISFAISFPAEAASKRSVSASRNCVLRTFAASFATATSLPKAKSSNTSIEGPLSCVIITQMQMQE